MPKKSMGSKDNQPIIAAIQEKANHPSRLQPKSPSLTPQGTPRDHSFF
jgi:hypothetical protein